MKMRRFWLKSAKRFLAQHLGSKMITKIADEPVFGVHYNAQEVFVLDFNCYSLD